MDTVVGLVTAYLELCGYFVLAELPVRAPDEQGYHDVTDIDLIAVRFAHEPHALSRRAGRPLDVLLGVDPELGSVEDGLDVLIGEVKEGEARLNPALRRGETAAFALRRIGCCAEEAVEDEAERLIAEGQRELMMPAGMRCRVRLVAFGGYGGMGEHAVRILSLGHCAGFIERRLQEGRDVLVGVQFADPVLGLFSLREKLRRLLVRATGARQRAGAAAIVTTIPADTAPAGNSRFPSLAATFVAVMRISDG